MRELRGTKALVTGAAGGLGRHIADALAAEGVSLALSGRNPQTLEQLCAELRRRGVTAEPVLADLSDLEQAASLVERAEAVIGPLDLLVSNAGIEVAAAYPAFTDDELSEITTVNLIAPMVLARHALPGMLARGRGHIITVASLAGRGGNAYNALYATTKAGLVGFTRSLHAELSGSPVGASVICPGFIAGDGMYAKMQEVGVDAPLALRAVAPERVARAVIDAIADDPPDLLVTGWPMRPLLAIQELSPRLAERLIAIAGADKFFARLADHTDRVPDRAPVAAREPAPLP